MLELYEAQTRDKLSDYHKKTSRQKYAKSEAYATFKQSIYVGPMNPLPSTHVSDTALGGTALKRGNAACSGILASRSAKIPHISVLVTDLMDQRREIIVMTTTTISKWAVCCKISTAP